MNTAEVHQLDDYRQGETMPKKGYTKLPNWIADTPMSVFERSMLTLIARESLGYQKNIARLSLAELMGRQQLSKNTVLKIQKKLTEKGWLFIGKTNGGRCSKTTYSIPSNPSPNSSPDEPFKGEKGSRDELLTEGKTVHEMNTTCSPDEPFKAENGSRDEHARIKKDIKESIKEIPPVSPKGENSAPEKPARRKKAKTSLPKNFTISERVKKWAEGKNYTRLDIHLENFILACKAKGYQYVDWDAAFMTAIRNNWAKVQPEQTQPVRKGIIDEMLEDDFDRGMLEHAYRNREPQP